MDVNCNYCININIKEEEQTHKKEEHICRFYNKRVYHRAFSVPRSSFIYPCKECVDDSYKNFKSLY